MRESRGKRVEAPKSWAQKQEQHARKMAAKSPEQVEQYAYNYALWHLSRRALPEADLRRKMTAKLVPDDVIERTMQRLRDMGAVDDLSYAQAYARSATRGRSVSLSRVRRDLAGKGIADDVIAAALEEVSAEQGDDAEWKRALAVAVKKARATQRESDPGKRRQKIITAVASKGFHFPLAVRAADEALLNT